MFLQSLRATLGERQKYSERETYWEKIQAFSQTRDEEENDIFHPGSYKVSHCMGIPPQPELKGKYGACWIGLELGPLSSQDGSGKRAAGVMVSLGW